MIYPIISDIIALPVKEYPNKETERFQSFEHLITPEEQEKLHRGRILIAGCGTGSLLAPHLAREGIGISGVVYLADPSVVQKRNIDRQFYFPEDIGVNKSVALARNIAKIEPRIKTAIIEEGISVENLATLSENVDCIVEMIDVSKPGITFALHDAARKNRVPVVTGLDLADNTLSYIFDYRKDDNMGYREFFGIPEDIRPEELDNLNNLALSAQLIIGPSEKSFSTLSEVTDYYSDTYFSEPIMQQIAKDLPEEMLPVVEKLLNGELDHVPQSDIAGSLLGAIHARAVKNILLSKQIRRAPEKIKIYLSQLV